MPNSSVSSITHMSIFSSSRNSSSPSGIIAFEDKDLPLTKITCLAYTTVARHNRGFGGCPHPWGRRISGWGRAHGQFGPGAMRAAKIDVAVGVRAPTRQSKVPIQAEVTNLRWKTCISRIDLPQAFVLRRAHSTHTLDKISPVTKIEEGEVRTDHLKRPLSDEITLPPPVRFKLCRIQHISLQLTSRIQRD